MIAAHGRHFLVAPRADAAPRQAVTRGKRNDVACGDRVLFTPLPADGARIEAVLPRSTLLFRADAVRQKLIAANADLALIVTATEPSPNPELITRCLVAAESQQMPALIVLNKWDLSAQRQRALQLLEPFRAAGYEVLTVSALADVSALAQRLRDRQSALVGASGVGKSSLINALIPHAAARVGEISQALQSGRHTTTATRLYACSSGWIIDSPGLQQFGLLHVAPQTLAECFPEFRPLLGQCRFRDCRHEGNAPGCAIVAAVEKGQLRRERWQHYQAILTELCALPDWQQKQRRRWLRAFLTAARKSP